MGRIKSTKPTQGNVILTLAFVCSIFVVKPWNPETSLWSDVMGLIASLQISKDVFFWTSIAASVVLFNAVSAASAKWITRTNFLFGIGYSLCMMVFLSTYASKDYYNTGGAISGITQMSAALYAFFLRLSGVKDKAEGSFSWKQLLITQGYLVAGFMVAFWWPWKTQSSAQVFGYLGSIGAVFGTLTTVGFSAGWFRKHKILFNLGIFLGTFFLLLSGFGQFNPGSIMGNLPLFVLMGISLVKRCGELRKAWLDFLTLLRGLLRG